MRTVRSIYHSNEAKVNAAVLTVVLFGLLIVGMAGFIIPGGEDPPPVMEITSEDRHQKSSDTVNDEILGLEATEDGDLQSRERLESLRNSIGSIEPVGHVALQGRVVDEVGNAVQGAEVKAILIQTMTKTLRPEDYVSFKAKSTDEGRFEFDRVPMGKYSIEATDGTHGGHTEAFVVDPRIHPAAVLKEHEIVLKQVGMIAGRVTGPDGEPVPGATIMPSPHSTCFVQADNQGHFVLINLEIGIYSLLATASGLAGGFIRDVRIGRTDVEISLSEGGSIRGQVTLEGKPVAGITVTTGGRSRRSTPVIPVEAVTRKDGRYVLSPLRKGYHTPYILSDEFTDLVRKTIELAEGEHKDHVNIQLKQNGYISGRVTDVENDEPVEGIWVCGVPKSLSPHMWFDRYYLYQGDAYALTDQNGRYALSCRSSVDLTIATRGGKGYLPALWENEKTKILVPGERKDGVNFQLRSGPALVVKVCTNSGDAVTGAKLTLRYPGQLAYTPENELQAALFPQVIEEAEGRYVFDGFPAGVFELQVMKRGWNWAKETVIITKAEEPPEHAIQLSPSITVQGRVIDPSNNGVKDALVSMATNRMGVYIVGGNDSKYTLTGEDGNFIIHDICTGSNDVNVSAEGYLSFSNLVKIVNDNPPLEIMIKPEGTHFLSGVVRNDLGEALSGVDVRIYQYNNNHRLNKTAETKEDGTFGLTGLMEGRVQLSLSQDNGYWKDQNQEISLDRNDLEITLQRYACIKGRVFDSSGTPVKRFSMYPSRKGGGMYSPPKSFSNGDFDLDKVPPGEVTLLITSDSYIIMGNGHESESEPYILAPGEVREGVSITLKETGTLTGIIKVKATSKPVNGASIRINESGNDRFPLRHSPAKATTGEDGSFTIDKHKPGIVDVYASHPDYSEGCLKQVEVLSGGTTGPIEILLDRGGVIRGQVLVDGKGKAGIKVVALTQRPYQGFQTVTGAEGRYEIKGLSQAEYEISATLRDDSKRSSVERTINVQAGEIINCDLMFEQESSVEGTVYILGKPAGEVSVRLTSIVDPDQNTEAQRSRSMSVETAQDGSYRIERLGPGKYNLSAYNTHGTNQNYSFQEKIEINSGVNVFDIQMGKIGSCEVIGFVYENDIPAANVEVSLSVAGRHSMANSRANSDKNGSFRFSNLPAGKARIWSRLTKKNRFNLRKQFELREGESLRQDLHYATGSGVLIGVVRENGKPLSDIQFLCRGETADGLGKVSIDLLRPNNGDDGYRFDFLPAGRYVLHISGLFPIRQEITLKAAEEVRVDFDLATGSGSIQGTVNGPGYEKESGTVRVCLIKPGTCPWQEGKAFKEMSFKEGGLVTILPVRKSSYSRDKLPAGTFDVVAVRQKEGKILKLDIKRVTLEEGESKTVDLDVTRK